MDIKTFDRVVGSLAEDFANTGLERQQYFPYLIARMNNMYSLPIAYRPTLDLSVSEDSSGENPLQRLVNFTKTLQEELNESLEVQAAISFAQNLEHGDRGRFMVAGDLSLQSQEFLEAVGSNLRVFITDDKEWSTAVLKYTSLLHYSVRRLVAAEADSEEDVDQYGILQVAATEVALVMLADWFGDMVVYIRSEALKFGLPLEAILGVIMGSNFTKLGDDGQPIKNDQGKVLKGPNFLPPEHHLRELLFGGDRLFEQYAERKAELERLEAATVPALSFETDSVIDAVLTEGADVDVEDLDGEEGWPV